MADTTTIELAVEGMHCGSCSALIEETLIDNPAIPEVKVDLDGARAMVTIDPERVTVAEVCATITDLGYPAAPVPA